MSWDNDTKLSKNFSLREFTKSQTAARHGIDNFVYDEEVFKRDVNKIDFGSIYNIGDPEVACSVFISLIMNVVNKHAPMRKPQKNPL